MAFPATRRQLTALRYIRGYREAHGRSPTLGEIARGVGLYGAPQAHSLVGQLKERGHARNRAKSPRSIELVDPPSIPRSPDGAPLFMVPGFEALD